MNQDTADFYRTLAHGFATADCRIDDGLLLAVSGGADSIALLCGTISLWPNQKQKIAVAHVNHALRGTASDEDAAFVTDLASQYGLQYELLTVEQGSIENVSSGSLEAAARDVRYEFLKASARKLQLRNVVTAHHFDDQAETVVHNIIRGTGLRGLAGMQCSRPLADGIELVRPMLNLRPFAILSYLAESDQGHRVDASNTDTAFTRNRIRSQLLPHLREHFNSSVDDHLVSLANQTQEALRMLDLFADQILSEVVLEQTPDICRIDRGKFAKWPEEVRRHCLALLWIRQQWPRQKMNARSYTKLATATNSSELQRGDLPGGVSFEVCRNILRLTRPTIG